MKKIVTSVLLIGVLLIPSIALASQAKGLNVIINSGESQTQAMAMVLSLMTVKKHHKKVNIVLCGKAGDLADKNIEGALIKKPNGKVISVKQHLQKLIKMGVSVQICPLYLPNVGKDKSILLDGVTVAKPPKVAGNLLDTNYQNITF
jgi:hypothetical protein